MKNIVITIILSFCIITKINVEAVSCPYQEPTWTGTKSLAVDYSMKYSIVSNHLYLKLTLNSINGGGWMGFGFSEDTSGSMLGADIVTVYLNGGQAVTEDRFVPFFAYPLDQSGIVPIKDNCSNWEVLSAERLSDTWNVVIRRELDTQDSQDRIIKSSGNMAVIWAYAKVGSVSYHGNRVGFGQMDFSLAAPPAFIKPADANGEINVVMNNANVPAQVTAYMCQIIDLGTSPRHAIAFEPIIDRADITHHILLHACGTDISASPLNNREINTPYQCGSPLSSGACKSLLLGWAVGGGAFSLPAEAGFVLGENGSRYLVLEIHYNNHLATAGLVDTSGMKMHTTTAMRPNDAASLSIGDVTLSSTTLAGNTKNQLRVAACPASCTNSFAGSINVFASFLHMHSYGKQIWTTKYPSAGFSSGVVTNRIDFWNFEFQQTTHVNFVIDKGNHFTVHGIFDTSLRSQPVAFGGASSDEMLFDFLFVWPASNLNNIFRCGKYGANNNLCGEGTVTSAAGTTDSVTSLPDTFGLSTATACINSKESGAFCTTSPSKAPTKNPTTPTKVPTNFPTENPTKKPSDSPLAAGKTALPSSNPTTTSAPVTKSPSKNPTKNPTGYVPRIIPVGGIGGSSDWITGLSYVPIPVVVGDKIQFSITAAHDLTRLDISNQTVNTVAGLNGLKTADEQVQVLNKYSSLCTFTNSVLIKDGPDTNFLYEIQPSDAGKLIVLTCSKGTHCSQGLQKILLQVSETNQVGTLQPTIFKTSSTPTSSVKSESFSTAKYLSLTLNFFIFGMIFMIIIT